MEKFVIEGGTPLSGTVVPAGNKNGALPILAACVLSSEEIVVRNVPRIRDVEAMLAVLEGLGVTVNRLGEHEISLCAADVDPHAEIDRGRAEAIRASFLLAGPLLARFGRAVMPPPGGDVIGRRRLDPHLDGFAALGASFRHERDIVIDAPVGGLRAGADLHGRAVGDGDRERRSWRRRSRRARPSSATPPASRTSRTSRACS